MTGVHTGWGRSLSAPISQLSRDRGEGGVSGGAAPTFPQPRGHLAGMLLVPLSASSWDQMSCRTRKLPARGWRGSPLTRWDQTPPTPFPCRQGVGSPRSCSDSDRGAPACPGIWGGAVHALENPTARFRELAPDQCSSQLNLKKNQGRCLGIALSGLKYAPYF